MCKKAVSVQFKGTTFSAWLLMFVVLSSGAGYIFGSLACITLLVAAIPVTLFASVHQASPAVGRPSYQTLATRGSISVRQQSPFTKG